MWSFSGTINQKINLDFRGYKNIVLFNLCINCPCFYHLANYTRANYEEAISSTKIKHSLINKENYMWLTTLFLMTYYHFRKKQIFLISVIQKVAVHDAKGQHCLF